jgi:hypothetical protein
LNNLDALSDMTDEVERTYFEQDKAYMHHIGELPSYSGMNYAIAEQDRIFEYEQDEVDDSVEGVVLEEADENDTENAVTTDREDETRMSAVNIYYGTNENPQLSNFAIRPFNFNIEQDDRTTRTVRFNSVE